MSKQERIIQVPNFVLCRCMPLVNACTYNMQTHNQSLSHHATLKPLQDAHPGPGLRSEVDWCHPRCKGSLSATENSVGRRSGTTWATLRRWIGDCRPWMVQLERDLEIHRLEKKGLGLLRRVKFKFGLENCVRSHQPNPLLNPAAVEALLAVAAATSWFTKEQLDDIDTWCLEAVLATF